MTTQINKFIDLAEQRNTVSEGVAVSVCMITYNHAAYIAQAIESVLMQKTTFSIELCIGEDHSTDETRAICLKYAQQYPKVIRLFLREKNDKIYFNGKPTGKKNGILTRQACRGKYIASLEGDDFWIDELKLQRQFDLMESNPGVGICCTRAIRRFTDLGRDQVFPPSRVNSVCQESFFGMRTNIATATFFCRRSFEQRAFTFNPMVQLGDWALLVSLTENGRKCLVLPVVSAVYRKHNGGFWSGGSFQNSERLRISIQTAVEYLKVCPSDVVKPLTRSVRQLQRKLKLSESSVVGFRRVAPVLLTLGIIEGLKFYSELLLERFKISILKR